MTERATEISSTIIKTSSCKHTKATSPIFLSQLEAANSNVSGTGFVKLSRLSGPGISHSYNELLFVIIEISCYSYKTYKYLSALRVDISASLLAPPEDPGDEVGYLGNGGNTK